LFRVAQFAEAADVSLRIGTAAAFGAALTGWADWSDTKDGPKRVGIVHAALNGLAVTGYLASLALRGGNRRRMGAFVAIGSYMAASASAYLGGELSSGMLLGTKHTFTPKEPPDEFVRVCKESDVPDGGLKRADVSGIAVLLSRSGTVVSAVANACTHRGGPLDEGTREGDCVRCPWHGARFDLRDGSVREGPATFPLAPFEVRILDGHIELR
jgi:nitrite reductase/ring-hydroxylating ferredoxin subunit